MNQDRKLEAGTRVVTAHGPTGRDEGVVVSHEFGQDLQIGGEFVEPRVRQDWYRVKLDSGEVMSLDYRTDGFGRIVVVV